MSRGDLDTELERLRAATDAVGPEDGLTDAILGAVQRAGAARDPLADIAKATAAIDAPEALTSAIVARIADVKARGTDAARAPAPVIAIEDARRPAPRRAGSWMDGVTRSGPIAVGLGIVAAAASFLFFVTSQGEVDATVVSAVDTVEVLE